MEIGIVKVGFIESGASDCPILCLHDFTLEQVAALWDIACKLHRGDEDINTSIEKIQLQSATGSTLSFGISETDEGVTKSASGSGFIWNMSRSGWRAVAGAIDPFREGHNNGAYQWLDETSDISVLLSQNGRW